MKIKLKAGNQYSICSCGVSKTMPYCDNAHRAYNDVKNTEYKSLKITPDKDLIIEVTSSRWKTKK